jgi:hypothetical protein
VDLLEALKYLSLNQQVVKATAMSAWSAFHSSDGSSGAMNPVGTEMFSSAKSANGKNIEGDNSRRGPGQDEGDGHARDARLGGVERVQGTA